jgi:hypothetical protein
MSRSDKRQLCTIKLTASDRAALRDGSSAELRRQVEWTIPNRVPSFDRAYVDAGGTDLWGPGPYLKVPNRDVRDGGEYVDRIFCPWGYPPRKLRVMRTRSSVAIEKIGLEQSDACAWCWVLTVMLTK